MNDAPSEERSADDVLNPDTYRPLYPEALLDGLAMELRIESEEARLRFEDTVLFAAGVYKATKDSLQRKAPRHRETKALEKIAKRAEELTEAILEAQRTGLAYPRLFACGMPGAKEAIFSSASPDFRKVLEILAHGDTQRMSMSPHAIQETIQFLKLVAETAALDESSRYNANQNWPIERWLAVLGQSWKTFTDLTFTVGRYYAEIGYKNPTPHVLHEIMIPLDPQTTRQQIESSLRKISPEIHR